MSGTIFFNAIHAPVGAHSSLTLGCKGRLGGLGRELGNPARKNLFIGLENPKGYFEALPFWEGGTDESLRFDHMKEKTEEIQLPLRPFADSAISREFSVGRDIWTAGDFRMEILSPVLPAPDPAKAGYEAQKFAYCPAVLVEITVDNTKCDHARRAFFGYETDGLDGVFQSQYPIGVVNGRATALFTDDPNAIAGCGFSGQDILLQKCIPNLRFGLGTCGMLMFTAKPGEKAVFHMVAAFFREGLVTTGLECSYWYARFFKGLNDVGAYALANFELYRNAILDNAAKFDSPNLNDAQRFQIAHSIASYYNSTQLLDHAGKPLWIVHEGEYRMMNTFDLVVDQLFFEMKMNPWTVRSELELFVDRYSYVDQVHAPGDANTLYPGGLSFNHDVGCRNAFAAPGRSAYECDDKPGCFSHMTHEQLVNWILSAATYTHQTGDNPWGDVPERCFDSMLNRDAADPADRNGVMDLDSSRTVSSSEITTYDSLDASLGQARANAYLVLKSFASYLALVDLIPANRRTEAMKQAHLAADSLVAAFKKNGFIPAILDGSCDSHIIPAIEGLIFPWILGKWDLMKEFPGLLDALKGHFTSIMESGECLYADGGWKLSSSADNSWLSKIYLNQFIARKLLGVNAAYTGVSADEAHRAWLLKKENLEYAWSDQMTSGVAKGSKYYPRGVTSILWTLE